MCNESRENDKGCDDDDDDEDANENKKCWSDRQTYRQSDRYSVTSLSLSLSFVCVSIVCPFQSLVLTDA